VISVELQFTGILLAFTFETPYISKTDFLSNICQNFDLINTVYADSNRKGLSNVKRSYWKCIFV
jgi:hypothetical protein